MTREQVPDFDLYKMLEVDPGASTETIEAAHRSLVRRFHPDVQPDASTALAHTAKLNVARDWLTDPAKREIYDRSRRSAGPGAGQGSWSGATGGESARQREQGPAGSGSPTPSNPAGRGTSIVPAPDRPAPGRVVKGQRVGFGVVQHVGQGWYLITSDGGGLYGNEGRRGGPGVGCGCRAPEPRVNGGEAVRYEIVGSIPPRYAGTPASGYICGICNRAIVDRKLIGR